MKKYILIICSVVVILVAPTVHAVMPCGASLDPRLGMDDFMGLISDLIGSTTVEMTSVDQGTMDAVTAAVDKMSNVDSEGIVAVARMGNAVVVGLSNGDSILFSVDNLSHGTIFTGGWMMNVSR